MSRIVYTYADSGKAIERYSNLFCSIISDENRIRHAEFGTQKNLLDAFAALNLKDRAEAVCIIDSSNAEFIIEGIRDLSRDAAIIVIGENFCSATDVLSKAAENVYQLPPDTGDNALLALADSLLRKRKNSIENEVHETIQFESIIETMGDALFIVDPAGTVHYANTTACLLTGQKQENIKGKDLADLIVTDYNAQKIKVKQYLV